MTAFSLYIMFCVLVAFAAKAYGRGAYSWILLSVLLTPVISGIILLLYGPVSSKMVDNATII